MLKSVGVSSNVSLASNELNFLALSVRAMELFMTILIYLGSTWNKKVYLYRMPNFF